MKFTKIISKNIKRLLRARSSAFIVIFGPLIIILLVGLALNKPSTYELSIGYFSPDQNNALTQSFIEEIKNNNYVIIKYEKNETCIQGIKQGTTHTCIIFPKNFEMGNDEHNNIDFYVDYSRTNIVYQIIDAVSKEFELRTTELSKDLTQVLLTKIQQTQKEIDEDILSIITIKSTVDGIITNIQDAKTKSQTLDFSMETISLTNIKSTVSDIYDDAKDLKDQGISAIDEAESLLGGNVSSSSLTDIEEEINDIYNDTPETYEHFENLTINISAKISKIKSNLKSTEDKNKY